MFSSWAWGDAMKASFIKVMTKLWTFRRIVSGHEENFTDGHFFCKEKCYTVIYHHISLQLFGGRYLYIGMALRRGWGQLEAFFQFLLFIHVVVGTLLAQH